MNLKWDTRFMELAEHISRWSKDPSTQVGSVITQKRRIVSVGYNGFPEGVNDNELLLADRVEKYPRMIHSELNAILNAKRSVEDCTLYCTHTPCDDCAKAIITAGISRIVCKSPNKKTLYQYDVGISIMKKLGIFNEYYKSEL